MGAPPEMVAEWRKAMAPDDELLLLPDVYHSVRVFDAMSTQWDRAGERGVKVGLKFNRAPIFLRICQVPLDKRQQVLEDLVMLERHTLEIYEEQRE